MAVQILVMGGTRFIGKPLVAQLLAAGHELTLFTRGRQPLPEGVEHLSGDRSDPADPTRFSTWPDGPGAARPRSATVVVRKVDGGPIGS